MPVSLKAHTAQRTHTHQERLEGRLHLLGQQILPVGVSEERVGLRTGADRGFIHDDHDNHDSDHDNHNSDHDNHNSSKGGPKLRLCGL